MDLPDIMTIVQWGATCTISTLWQRFGRCVRDPNLQGIAVLFTAKENLDTERQRRVERAEKRCATATLKKQAKRQKTNAYPIVKTEGVDELDHSDEEKEEAKAVNLGHEKEKRAKNSAVLGKSKKVLDVVVDHLINAEFRGIECRRIPIMNAFKNNEAGE